MVRLLPLLLVLQLVTGCGESSPETTGKTGYLECAIFPAESGPDFGFAREMVFYWQATYDPAEVRFLRLDINGEA